MDVLKKLEKDKDRFYFLSKEAADYILNLMKARDVKTVLEVGTAKGYAAILFAMNCESVTTVEKYTQQYKTALDNILASKLNNIKIIHKDFLDLDLCCKFDMVFIDGNKGETLACFKKALKFVNNDGLIIVDDIEKKKHRMEDFLKYVNNFNHMKLNIGHGLAIVNPLH